MPLPRTANPFALMIDPQAVIAAIEHSERLERLQRRVCRPLDRPLIAKVEDEDEAASAYDREIDESSDGAADDDGSALSA